MEKRRMPKSKSAKRAKTISRERVKKLHRGKVNEQNESSEFDIDKSLHKVIWTTIDENYGDSSYDLAVKIKVFLQNNFDISIKDRNYLHKYFESKKSKNHILNEKSVNKLLKESAQKWIITKDNIYKG